MPLSAIIIVFGGLEGPGSDLFDDFLDAFILVDFSQ